MNTIEKMVPHDISRGVVAAFSGGADSLALLITLLKFVDNKNIVALYVNHRLRPEEELKAEEALNRHNCRALNIALEVVTLEEGAVERCAIERGKGIEDAARHLRYRDLNETAERYNYTCIATGHTLDDQGETLLMRLLQGAGPLSMGGIEPQLGKVIRPLLTMQRGEVEALVKGHHLEWSTDSTNLEEAYLRNQIRHRLIPVVKEIFPNYLESLALVGERNRSLTPLLQPLIEEGVTQVLKAYSDRVELDLIPLENLPRVAAEQVVYRGWNLLTNEEGSRFPFRFVTTLLDRVEQGWGEGEVLNLSNTTIKRSNSKLVWQLGREALAFGYLSLIYSKRTPLGGKLDLVVEDNRDDEVGVRLDPATLTPPLVARSFRESDTITLADGTKKVSSLLGEWKIDPHERWLIPVLEDRNGVVAILGEPFGGRNRVARRCLLPPLARNGAPLYSVVETKG